MEESNFICSARDCNLRFPCEDTLLLHKKRHEMVLSLNKSNVQTSDQTPTPIRFMRQCEEIGLFQDLQNVNPFEETFRKAAEAVKKGSMFKQTNLSILNAPSSDELHTPHIFPDEINIESSIAGMKDHIKDIRPVEEIVIRTEADTSLKPNSSAQNLPPMLNDRVSTTVSVVEPGMKIRGYLMDNGVINEEQVVRVTPSITTTVPQYTTAILAENTVPVDPAIDPVQVLLRMPNGSLVQLATKPVTAPIVPVNLTPPPIQLEESIKILPRTCTNGGTVILATNNLQKTNTEPQPTVQSNGMTTKDVKQKLKQLLGSTSKSAIPLNNNQQKKNNTTTVNKKETSAKKSLKNDNDNPMDESEKEKRIKILERNRKAAIRCRERRKRWVEELRKRADTMAVTNRSLNEEIRCLKTEVANLRTLLLAHANCPVTLAQQSTSQEDIPINNDEVANKRPRRECLTLDIEQARAAAIVSADDLDTPTPTLVRNDRVLSSVAPPATPEQDRLVTFTDILTQDRNNEIHEEIVDRQLTAIGTTLTNNTTTTTVIQINPNAIKAATHGFS